MREPDDTRRCEPVRAGTAYPCLPEVLVRTIRELAGPLPAHDWVSVGFPGMVGNGRILDLQPGIARTNHRRYCEVPDVCSISEKKEARLDDRTDSPRWNGNASWRVPKVQPARAPEVAAYRWR